MDTREEQVEGCKKMGIMMIFLELASKVKYFSGIV